jgi:GNAT superfamily N-acetyltransferase
MWIRTARAEELQATLAVDDQATNPRRISFITNAIERGECLIAGRDTAPEALLIMTRKRFFSRDFIDLVTVSPAARRAGLASALMDAAEKMAEGEQVFVSTNESNRLMQEVLAKRGYLPAGLVTHLDPGDPELFYVKYLNQ